MENYSDKKNNKAEVLPQLEAAKLMLQTKNNSCNV